MQVNSNRWIDRMMKISDLEMLQEYFIYDWNKPVSYYNAYSSFLYSGKVKLMNHLSIETYSCFLKSPCGTLLLQIGREDPIFHLIAPKDEMAASLLCKKLKTITNHPIILHVPDFEPNANTHIVYRNYEQIVYDCSFIVESIDNDIFKGTELILKSRSKSTFKKNILECSYRKVLPTDLIAIETLMQHWIDCAKAKNKKQHMFKDYYSLPWALKNSSKDLMAFLGNRKEHPVSYSLLTVLPSFRTIAVQLISKSLNYKTAPGGYNETSVWELYKCSKECIENGISHINASDLGPNGLKSFKEKFKGKATIIKCQDWGVM